MSGQQRQPTDATCFLCGLSVPLGYTPPFPSPHQDHLLGNALCNVNARADAVGAHGSRVGRNRHTALATQAMIERREKMRKNAKRKVKVEKKDSSKQHVLTPVCPWTLWRRLFPLSLLLPPLYACLCHGCLLFFAQTGSEPVGCLLSTHKIDAHGLCRGGRRHLLGAERIAGTTVSLHCAGSKPSCVCISHRQARRSFSLTSTHTLSPRDGEGRKKGRRGTDDKRVGKRKKRQV